MDDPKNGSPGRRDWSWDEEEPARQYQRRLRVSGATEVALGAGGVSLFGMPLGSLWWLLHALGTGDTGLLASTGPAFVLTSLLAIQLRLAVPVAAERGILVVHVGWKDVELRPQEIAWILKGASPSKATEVGLLVSLKRRRFFGAKWLYVAGDVDGHVLHFLRGSGARLLDMGSY